MVILWRTLPYLLCSGTPLYGVGLQGKHLGVAWKAILGPGNSLPFLRRAHIFKEYVLILNRLGATLPWLVNKVHFFPCICS